MNIPKYVCHQCVPEKYIQKLIKVEGDKENKCSYCKKKILNISIAKLANLFDEMIDVHYEPMLGSSRKDTSGSDAYPIIIDELQVSDKLAV